MIRAELAVLAIDAQLRPLFGLHAEVRPWEYIHVPITWRVDEWSPVEVRVPESYAPTLPGLHVLSSAVLDALRGPELDAPGDLVARFVLRPQGVLVVRRYPDRPRRHLPPNQREEP